MTLQTTALLCLTLMTGNEICVAAFVNPVLRQLPESEQIPFLSRAARHLGLAMPFWYAASLVLTVMAATGRHHHAGSWKSGPSVAAGLQLMVLILTIGFMVPINNTLGKLKAGDVGWTEKAKRWDRMHQARVLLLLFAVVGLALY